MSGILNPATGALGLWAWWTAFVVWVLLASVVLIGQERRQAKTAVPVPPTEATAQGAVR